MKKIICPICGAEYLIEEIFIPEYFFGKPQYIEKNDNGKILNYIGKDMDLVEKYKCDYCNKYFTIKADISIKCEPNDISNFSETYETKIEKHRLVMEEL